MGCLFCGKDIGAFRLLRDNEFCSAAHRKQYSARLGKALGQIAAPEPPPAGIAAFRIAFPVKEGNAQYSGNLVFGHRWHPVRTQSSIPVKIQPTLGAGFASSTWPSSIVPRASESPTQFAADPSWGTPARAASLLTPPCAARGSQSFQAAGVALLDTGALDAGTASALCPAAGWSGGVRLRFLGFGLQPDLWDFGEERAEITPAPAGRWTRCVSPEPAARMVWAVEAAARFAQAPVQLPDWHALAIAPTHVESSAEYWQVPTPEPAVAELLPSTALDAAGLPAPALRLPETVFQPAADEALALESIAAAGPAPLTAALAAKSFPAAAAFDAAPSMPVAVLRLPEPLLDALAEEGLGLENFSLADPAELPAAPVESMPSIAAFEAMPLPAAARVRLPEPVAEGALTLENLRPAGLAALPAASPVESMPAIAAFDAVPVPASAALWLPDGLPAAAEPAILSEPALATPAAAPQAWPVESMPAITGFQAAPVAGVTRIRAAAFATAPPANLASCAVLPASPVESMPAIAAFAPVPVSAAPALALPGLEFRRNPDFAAAAFGNSIPGAAAPAFAETAGAGVWQRMPALALRRPSTVESRCAAAIPEPGFIETEFHSERGSAPSVIQRPEWKSPEIALALPRFAVRPILGPLENLLVQKPRALSMARILSMPRSSGMSDRMGNVAKIAASLLVVFATWMGARMMVRGGNPTVAVNRPVASAPAAPAADNSAGSGDVADGAPVVSEPSSLDPKGPLARVRRAIASRAAVELTDNFEKGMQAWGAAPKSWPTGWQHSPDGYVKTGPLALYKPAHDFQDYRLEFFGQIENKSMSWAVRARDKKNFYAMKFTVIETGLRPIIAMVHYPVVGGKNGHRVEVPLNVMVHNDTPYHVSVDVQGNRITTSIEGQQVDSWTDDTLVAGGVGFFSDAGERARLYWMRVSKNQDLLGRICAYLSGGKSGAAQVAVDVGHPGIPGLPEQPLSQNMALAAVLGLSPGGERQREKDSKRRRNHPWNS